MGVNTLTYYKEYKCNGEICKRQPIVFARLVAGIIITLLLITIDAHAQVADTIVISAQARSRIDFKVNFTEFDRAYHGNESGLEKLLAKIDSMVLNPLMKVKRITVVGTASPEGPYRNNERLATERAKAFISILRSRYSFPDSIYAVSTIPEDWEGMRLMLADDSSITYAAVVIKFLDETEHLAPDTREYRLKQLDGGRPYASIRDNVLPYLRRASVRVDYDTRSLRFRQQLKAAEPVSTALDLTLPSLDIRPLDIPLSADTPPRWIPLVLKTNMLYDVAAIPNIGLEIALGRNWSVEADWMYAWWSHDIGHRYWRVYGGEVGVRRWFGGKDRRVLTGHHVGIYGQMLTYDFEFGGKGRQGGRWTWGGGVAYGYSLPVGRRLNIDFTIGFGYAGGEYKKYHPDAGCYVWDSTHRLNWFGPTKAEVSLVWYIDGRPARKGGAQ